MKLSELLICFALAFSQAACSRTPVKKEEEEHTSEIVLDDDELPPEEESEPPPEENAPPVQETPSPEPPAPEPPAQELPKSTKKTLLCSCVNGLNVRKGRGTSYASMGTLDANDMVSPVEKVGDWYKIRYCGTVGYVAANYVTERLFDKSSDKIEEVIACGEKLLGVPYVYGAVRYHDGNGVLLKNFTTAAFDCSSLMQYIFKIGAGKNLAVTSRLQSKQGVAVSRKDVRRGDLMFFTNASRKYNTGIERIGHVALYLGNNYILHTASDHAVIEPISQQRESYFICARRIVS